MRGQPLPLKPVAWIASSCDDLRDFPDDARAVMGEAIYQALKGFGGRSVLEIVDDSDDDTWRVVYTVRFAGLIYVLHAFQKKSKRGRATPKAVMDIIRQRLKAAESHFARTQKED